MLVEASAGAMVIASVRGPKELIEVGFGPSSGRASVDRIPGLFGDMPARPPTTPFLAVPFQSRRGFTGTMYLTERLGGGPFTDDEEQLIRSFAFLAATIIDNAQLSEEARQRELWMALHSEITTALLAGVSFSKVLDLVARGARELIDADVASLCLRDSPLTLVVNASSGRRAEELLGAVVDIDGSVSGEVVSSGEPVILTDARSDARTSEPILAEPGIETAMVVPLALQGRTTGALAVGRSSGKGPFSQVDFWLLESFATEISIALEYGRARTELERLTLLDDQERIARDLHDTVIQQLFATGMSLQATAQRIVEPNIAERVQQSIDTLDRVIRDIRSTVFALRSSTLGRGSLRRSLLEVAEQLQEPHDFVVHTSFEGPVDSALDAQKEAHLVAVLREALSNVARHACARSVEVTLTVDSEVTLSVLDDGVGFDERSVRKSGLLNLKARAEELRGSMTLSMLRNGGTALEWRIPLEEAEPPETSRSPRPGQPVGQVSPFRTAGTSNQMRLPARVRITPQSVDRASTRSRPDPVSSS